MLRVRCSRELALSPARARLTAGPALRTPIPPQSGAAVTLQPGDQLTITDPCGEQVADVACFPADDLEDGLSSGRTLDYNGTIRLTTGHALWSGRSRRLMTIIEDTCGLHDILLRPCSPEMFRIIYHHSGHHPSCFENLAKYLGPLGVNERAITSSFNVFMNVQLAEDGALRVLPPCSEAGARLTLVAALPLVVGITACSAELSNKGSFKPIDFEVIQDPTSGA